MPWAGGDLDDTLCEHYTRAVSNDNCLSFEGLSLQIPPDNLFVANNNFLELTMFPVKFIINFNVLFERK